MVHKSSQPTVTLFVDCVGVLVHVGFGVLTRVIGYIRLLFMSCFDNNVMIILVELLYF